MKPIIVTNGLTCRFDKTIAVNNLDLEVYSGEVLGLLGHNGAGKTTTIRLLNGVLAPSGGTVSVFGLSPVDDGPALRRRTGVLTESASLEERLTARENLSIYADLYGVPKSDVARRVNELLMTFELADRASEKVGGYSKGMKQRLALARALLHEPELLFLDEPTAGLDPVAARQVHQLITQLSRDERRTVLLCTHNLVEAQQLCDRVAVLEHGRLLAVGTPSELSNRFGGGSRLEIEVAPAASSAAINALRTSPYVKDMAFRDGKITIPRVDYEIVPDLLATLISSGIRVYQAIRKEPTLEDVYFALLGEKDGGT